MKIQAKLNKTQLKNILIEINGIAKDMNKVVMDSLIISANDIRNEMINGIRNTSRESYYYKRGTKVHYPSKPGNFPAPDTSDLITSIDIAIMKSAVEIGPTITQPNYPKYLEDGTEKMRKRPYVEPTFDRMESKVKDNIIKSVEKLI